MDIWCNNNVAIVKQFSSKFLNFLFKFYLGDIIIQKASSADQMVIGCIEYILGTKIIY